MAIINAIKEFVAIVFIGLVLLYCFKWVLVFFHVAKSLLTTIGTASLLAVARMYLFITNQKRDNLKVVGFHVERYTLKVFTFWMLLKGVFYIIRHPFKSIRNFFKLIDDSQDVSKKTSKSETDKGESTNKDDSKGTNKKEQPKPETKSEKKTNKEPFDNDEKEEELPFDYNYNDYAHPEDFLPPDYDYGYDYVPNSNSNLDDDEIIPLNTNSSEIDEDKFNY